MWNQSKEKLGVTGHRGCKAYMPENTLMSFSEAFRLGVDVLELDIQFTRDDVLIVMHDELVDRTTDGKGAVNFKTLAEMKALDAGVKFDEKFKGTAVPTLDEFLDLCDPHKELLLNLELKDYPAVEGDTIAFSTVDIIQPGQSAEISSPFTVSA